MLCSTKQGIIYWTVLNLLSYITGIHFGPQVRAAKGKNDFLDKKQCDHCFSAVATKSIEVKYAYDYMCTDCYEENYDSSDRDSDHDFDQSDC